MGHGIKIGDLKAPDGIQNRFRLKGGPQNQAAPSKYHGMRDVNLAEHVVERQEAQGPIVLAGAFIGGYIEKRGLNIGVAQHRTFGCAGSAACIQDGHPMVPPIATTASEFLFPPILR